MLEEARAAIAGGMNQYPPGRGILPLRQAIAAHSSRKYGLSYDPETEVLVTTGATEALASSIMAFVNPGDEVIALEPFYDSYAASIELAGGRRVGVALFGPDFKLDHAELARAFTPKTKALLINTPHNPTGAVLDRADLSMIAQLAVQHDVVVICDEVYEHLTFDDAEHLPLATFPGMRERTVRISSAGKTFSATGWKIGWALATPELINEVTAVKQFLSYVLRRPVPAGGLPCSQRRRRVGGEGSARSTGQARPVRRRSAVGWAESARTARHYFMSTDVQPLGYSDGVEFCRELPGRCGVVAIPASGVL
jgi:N-succinyldiaminopimelate aminotransferase